jgi:hypothetical protein
MPNVRDIIRPYPGDLVEKRRGASYPLHVAAANHYRLSPRYLRRNWPGLVEECRRSGNRRLDPMTRSGFYPRNYEELLIEPWAWEYVLSRCAHLELQGRLRYQPLFRGLDAENPLFELFQIATDEFRYGNPMMGEGTVKSAVELFSRVCTLLAELRDSRDLRGYGDSLYLEVIEMARLFAPLVAEVDYQVNQAALLLFSMLEGLDEMTEGHGQTLVQVIQTLPHFFQDFLRDTAEMIWNTDRRFLAKDIYLFLT